MGWLGMQQFYSSSKIVSSQLYIWMTISFQWGFLPYKLSKRSIKNSLLAKQVKNHYINLQKQLTPR